MDGLHDASPTVGGDAGGTADTATLGQDYPDLPGDVIEGNKTGGIIFRVSNSSSEHISDGVYGRMHTANASSSGTAHFQTAGLADATSSGVVASFGLNKHEQSGSFSYPQVTLVIRNGCVNALCQLLSVDVAAEVVFDASTRIYSGTFSGRFGDGIAQPSDTKTANLKGRFRYRAKN